MAPGEHWRCDTRQSRLSSLKGHACWHILVVPMTLTGTDCLARMVSSLKVHYVYRGCSKRIQPDRSKAKRAGCGPDRPIQEVVRPGERYAASGRIRKLCIKLYKRLLMASGADVMDLTAMTLATADKQGRPSARVVLLKGVDQRGFIFYTNYDSRKGQELAQNQQAALVFYWPEQERQVCVAGEVSKLPPAESDAYFQSRPRGSRIAAWVSNQSAVVRDRAALEELWRKFEAQYAGHEVPGPPSGEAICYHRRGWNSGRGGPTGSTIASAMPGNRIRRGSLSACRLRFALNIVLDFLCQWCTVPLVRRTAAGSQRLRQTGFPDRNHDADKR